MIRTDLFYVFSNGSIMVKFYSTLYSHSLGKKHSQSFLFWAETQLVGLSWTDQMVRSDLVWRESHVGSLNRQEIGAHVVGGGGFSKISFLKSVVKIYALNSDIKFEITFYCRLM